MIFNFSQNQILVGLGNPGEKYKNNYHNVGFLFLDILLQKINEETGESFSFQNKPKLFSEICEVRIECKKLILAKPQTFMNRTGVAVKSILEFYKIGLENFLFAGDYIDKQVGEIDFKENFIKSSHNGIESIKSICSVNSVNFIRIGILPEIYKSRYKGKFDDLGVGNLSDFVLKNIPKNDLEKVTKSMNEFIETLLKS